MTDNLQSIDFYQLAGDGRYQLAAQLAEKTLAVGKKLVIYCLKEEAADLSRALWVSQHQNFLAHAIDEADGAEFAQVWISTELDKNHIGAEFAMCLSGLVLPDMAAFERQFVLFNGKDDSALATARDQWKLWRNSYQGKCRYFAKTDDGRWEQKATG